MMLHVFEDYKEGFLAEGREEGDQRRAYKVAISLLEDGMKDDRIQKHTELSLEEIAELRNKLQNRT